MTRIRLIITVGITAAMLLIGGVAAMSAHAADGLTTTLTTVTQEGGYRGTYAITNRTSTTIKGWTVAFILPVDARISASAGARLAANGQLVTAVSDSLIAPGATVTFTFDVTGGAQPPSNCLINGVPCPPSPQPSPTVQPSATPSAKPSGPGPAPTSAPTPSPSATPTPTPAPTTPQPTTPATPPPTSAPAR